MIFWQRLIGSLCLSLGALIALLGVWNAIDAPQVGLAQDAAPEATQEVIQEEATQEATQEADASSETEAETDSSTETPSSENGDPHRIAPNGDNSYCLVCHVTADDPAPLTWAQLNPRHSPRELSAVVHDTHVGLEAVGCLDCHASNTFPHLGARVLETKNWAFAEPYLDACINCHQEQEAHPEAGCMACHAGYDIDHDPAVLSVNLEDCAACHAPTIAEWQGSAHGDQQLACATCHFPHQDRLRFETVEALCLNCHDQSRDNYTHVVHIEQSCADCHVYHDTSPTMHIMTGGNIQLTGHDNLVSVRTCLDCHNSQEISLAERPSDPETIAARNALHPLNVAQTQIDTLEAQIEADRQAAATRSTLRLIQSLIIGFGLGVVGMVFFVRSRIYRGRSER